jgi:glutamyl-Q tRNA(Asp) synthetase
MLGSSMQLNTNCVTRFAPSPTGRLHLGHAYSAMLSHDLARSKSGQFLLRIEDIDQGRCRAEFVDGIMEDLGWLGLNWDAAVIYQSDRSTAYGDALLRLIDLGLVFKCWCTRAEIAAQAASAPQGAQRLYPGTCRHRSDGSPDPLPFSWRLDVQAALDLAGPLFWQDQQAGHVLAQPQLLGDVIVARKDAGTSYHIAVVVDDAWQGVTEIVRGSDLFEATHIHRLLQAVLDLPTPLYHHHPLVLDAEGDRLAKRRGSIAIADLRTEGVNPGDLMAALRLGQLPDGYHLSA